MLLTFRFLPAAQVKWIEGPSGWTCRSVSINIWRFQEIDNLETGERNP
jgi:hypothetical protein